MAKKLLTPSVVNTVVKKVNAKKVTNSKDLRKLRKILRDPVAKEHFFRPEGDIDSAMLRPAPSEVNKKTGLAHDLEELNRLMTNYSWPELQKL